MPGPYNTQMEDYLSWWSPGPRVWEVCVIVAMWLVSLQASWERWVAGPSLNWPYLLLWSPSVSRYREWLPCAKCHPRLSEQERQMAALLMLMLGWRTVEESEEAVPRMLHVGDRTEQCQLGAVAEAP